MNYSYDLCNFLVGIQTTYDQPRFYVVKDAAVNSSNKIQFLTCCQAGIFVDF